MKSPTPKEKCIGITRLGDRAGERCGNWPINGATVCRKHGGGAPQVRATAAVRAEIAKWGLGDSTVDPGEMLLRLLSQSASRAEMYALELEQLVSKSDTLREAVIGKVWGEFGVQGEYVKGLVALEMTERKFCGDLAVKAVAAGLAKRQVEIAEAHARMMMAALDAALRAVGMSIEMQQVAKLAAVNHLKLLPAIAS